MEKLWKKNFIDIEPYTAGEQPKSDDIIKLNANENPYPPSPKVQETLELTRAQVLRLYPSMTAAPLRQAIALHCGKLYGAQLTEKNIFTGNGSDDVLATAFRAFFNSDKPIYFPDVTYSFYPVWCQLLKIPYKVIATDEDFQINAKDYAPENGGVVLPNPNAPTSIGKGLDFVCEILDENQDCVVIIDEAYIDFGGESAVKLINEYENLLVTQTFSKSRSLAGMRAAMAYGSPELIEMLDAVKDSYNSYPMDSVSIAAATASISDTEYMLQTTAKIIRTRQRLTDEMRRMGFIVTDSCTNFLFVKHPALRAEDVFLFLKNKGIYIRYWNKPRINEYLRITIGTDEQVDKLIGALEQLCAQSSK